MSEPNDTWIIVCIMLICAIFLDYAYKRKQK